MANEPVVIVTGAGSGIGRATALLMAEAGWRVALVGRTEANLRATRAALVGEAALFACDLADADAVAKLTPAVLARFGRVDALANVAGDAHLLPIARVTPDVWRRCIDTNLSCVVQLTAALWPTFERRGGGVIVNVSSMASIDPFPGFSIYAAAKVGLNMFTKCTAEEGKTVGIKAVCIAPGAVETPMLRGLFDEKMIGRDKTLAPETIAATIRDCITGRRAFSPGELIVMASP